MTEKMLGRLDAISMGLLLVWLGMALGFALLQAPTTFQVLNDRDMAGRIVGATLVRLDWVAWGAFALALGLSWLPRWLAEFKEMDGLGPLRLWSAAALVALLMCLASSFILTPKLEAIRLRAQVPIQTMAATHPDRMLHAKAHRISRQLLVLRMLLALSLVLGIGYLPRKNDAEPA